MVRNLLVESCESNVLLFEVSFPTSVAVSATVPGRIVSLFQRSGLNETIISLLKAELNYGHSKQAFQICSY